MKVEIDGKRFVPMADPMPPNNKMDAALNAIVERSDAGDEIMVRQYFATLLKTLWEEEEGFSGKRPFGNSGWTGEILPTLIEVGYIKGKVTREDDCAPYAENVEDKADAKILDLIQYMCCGSGLAQRNAELRKARSCPTCTDRNSILAPMATTLNAHAAATSTARMRRVESDARWRSRSPRSRTRTW